MKCLILAAGEGSRLTAVSESKPLTPFLGLTLIERSILTAHKAGITDFYVVLGHHGERILIFLDDLALTRNLNITTIENQEWEKGNGTSVLVADDYLEENFLLMMVDHVIESTTILNLSKEVPGKEEVILAVDTYIQNPSIDLEDVTRVLVAEGKILEIGKGIEKYTAFDTGLFHCSPRIFSALKESQEERNDHSLSGAIQILAEKGKARVFDIKEGYWADIDTPEDLLKAEKSFCKTLTKPTDGPVSKYINRPVSTWITRNFFLNTKITPNQITLFSFLMSVIGASCFLLGSYRGLVAGALLAYVSSIIDGCDGEVARLKFIDTKFGGWFDAVMDRYADGFLLFGLTYHTYFLTLDRLSFFVGFLAIIGSFVNSYTADKYDGFMRHTLKPTPFRLGRDVRLFIIFIGCILNMPFGILLFLAIVMNLENIRRIVLLSKGLAEGGPNE